MAAILERKHHLKISGVYAIVNILTKEKYIGSTRNLYVRIHTHQYELNRNRHDNKPLQESWNKYGSKNFKYKVIEITYDRIDREQFYLDRNYNLFNISKSASGRTGVKHSEETKDKLRKLNLGKILSEEVKRKIGDSQRGKIIPLKVRLNMSKSVLLFNSSMEFIQEFPSVKSAAEHIGCATTTVSHVASGKRNSVFGYKFRYKEVNSKK